MKELLDIFERYKKYTNILNEINEKKISHWRATHGHRRSDESKKVGEVINYSLTESGKIESYEVKFGNITETLSAEDFVATDARSCAHEAKQLKIAKLKEQ